MLGVVGVEAHHVGAEALRDDHRRIVLARSRAVDGVLLVGEHPVKLVVGAQRRLHAVANVDLRGQQVALISLVGIGDGHVKMDGKNTRPKTMTTVITLPNRCLIS